MLFSLFTFLVAISVVVVFHEWGHYLAARYFGIKVQRFSLGFGSVLFKRVDARGTEWVLSALPFGGYVKPLAEPDLSLADYQLGQSFAEKTPWQRLVVYFAGPFFSFLLGFLVYSAVYFFGTSEPKAILANPPTQTLAARAGVVGGDVILAVNDAQILSWPQAVDALIEPATLGQYVKLDLLDNRGGLKTIDFSFPAFYGNLEKVNLIREAGFELFSPMPTITKIIPDGPADIAGLQTGDIIRGLNQTPIESLTQFISLIGSHANDPVQLHIIRANVPLTIDITPELKETPDGRMVGRIRAQLNSPYPLVEVSYGPIDSILMAGQKTWNIAWFSLRMMGKMVTGQVSLKNISGPITIADYSGKIASYGFDRFIAFIALISISIGVLNLLPIPGLDGGQMLINFVEMVRGKPLSDQIIGWLFRVGVGLLGVLMVIAFSNDINRLLN